MSDSLLERRRTGWDLVLGALLSVAGLVILGNAAFATAVSVVFLGWMLVIGGLIAFVGAFFLIGKGGFWSAALSGALLGILGVVFLRNTGATALTLTLIAGTVFLVSGIMRLVVSANEPEYRAVLIFSGVVSTALGLLVLFNLFDATLVLLGVLLGVQALLDGITMMITGRWHPVSMGHGATPATP